MKAATTTDRDAWIDRLAREHPDFSPLAATELERYALRTFRRLDDAGKRELLAGLAALRDSAPRANA
jgi:hypothetical protein